MAQPQAAQESSPLSKNAEAVPRRAAAAAAVLLQEALRALPSGGVHQGGLLAVVDLALVAHLARVGDVRE
jgi:hypothetical protein